MMDGDQGMKVGTVRRLIVQNPPCMLDLELLSVKSSWALSGYTIS